MFKLFIIVFINCSLLIINDRVEANGKESWGYVDVRQDAHMFWWLYYANNSDNVKPGAYRSYPLIIWLQGGPGGSSTGFGNFIEIGPKDVDLKPRNTSWVKYANLLFIDNPVGTGFSYVSNPNAYAKNNSQIAIDLVTLLKEFFKKLPEFQTIPLYIFSESYGGKMTTTLAVQLYQTIHSGGIQCNFQGIALGDSWISPIDSVATWGQYLYAFSMIDVKEQQQIETVYVEKIREALKQKQYSRATDLWSETESFIEQVTDGVNWYNVLENPDEEPGRIRRYYSNLHKDGQIHSQVLRQVGRLHQNNLYDLMNGPVKKALNVIPPDVIWGGQSSQVFLELKGDFMLPVVDQIDYLLNNTALQIVVYSGQLDLIVDAIGTEKWINSLKWSGLPSFQNAQKTPLTGPTGNTGYFKTYKNFTFYWILKAGHMVPLDAGDTALQMLQRILQPKQS